MPVGNVAVSEIRCEYRDEVNYRTRAIHNDGRTLHLLVVNVSPQGFMARCEATVAEDDGLRILLPGLGHVHARVRWALGGRLGCEFDRIVAPADYDVLLAVLLR